MTHKSGARMDVSTGDDKAWLRADVMLQKGVRFDVLHSEIKTLLKM